MNMTKQKQVSGEEGLGIIDDPALQQGDRSFSKQEAARYWDSVMRSRGGSPNRIFINTRLAEQTTVIREE